MVFDEKLFDYSAEALYTMEGALEHPFPDFFDQHRHVCTIAHLPAAMILVQTAGHKICHWCHKAGGRPSWNDEPGGPLWDGQLGFSKGRWQLWRERFLALSGNTSLSKQCRDGAWRAADTMSDIEQSSSHVQV